MMRGMEDLITPIRTRLALMTQAERKAIADETGVSFSAIQKIATGETPNPRIDTWATLAGYFGAVCAMPKTPRDPVEKVAA